MPKEVLHILYETHEAQAFHHGEPVHIMTHGVEHVVVQVERRKYTKQHETLAVTGTPAQRLLPVPRQRPKNKSCQYCHIALSAQGKWKHELMCRKLKRKGGVA